MPNPVHERDCSTEGERTVGVIGAGAAAVAALLATVPLRVVAFSSRAEPLSFRAPTQAQEHTHDPSTLGTVDAIVITEPVTRMPAGGADLTRLATTARTVADQLRPGQVVALVGPVPPGTTRGSLLPLLANSGLAAERDYYLAHLAVPNEPFGRVVGGFGETSARMATELLTGAGLNVTQVSSLEAAELCGVVGANARVIQKAMTNELKRACDRMGTDAWEVLAASGFPVCEGVLGDETAASLLSFGARRWNASFRLSDIAAEINAGVPEYVVEKITDALNTVGKAVRGSHVALLGVTFKNDVNDLGESPGIEMIARLVSKGATVSYNDHHVPSLPRTDRGPSLEPLESQPLTPEYLASQDCVVIITNHTVYDYGLIVQSK